MPITLDNTQLAPYFNNAEQEVWYYDGLDFLKIHPDNTPEPGEITDVSILTNNRYYLDCYDLNATYWLVTCVNTSSSDTLFQLVNKSTGAVTNGDKQPNGYSLIVYSQETDRILLCSGKTTYSPATNTRYIDNFLNPTTSAQLSSTTITHMVTIGGKELFINKSNSRLDWWNGGMTLVNTGMPTGTTYFLDYINGTLVRVYVSTLNQLIISTIEFNGTSWLHTIIQSGITGIPTANLNTYIYDYIESQDYVYLLLYSSQFYWLQINKTTFNATVMNKSTYNPQNIWYSKTKNKVYVNDTSITAANNGLFELNETSLTYSTKLGVNLGSNGLLNLNFSRVLENSNDVYLYMVGNLNSKLYKINDNNTYSEYNIPNPNNIKFLQCDSMNNDRVIYAIDSSNSSYTNFYSIFIEDDGTISTKIKRFNNNSNFPYTIWKFNDDEILILNGKDMGIGYSRSHQNSSIILKLKI